MVNSWSSSNQRIRVSIAGPANPLVDVSLSKTLDPNIALVVGTTVWQCVNASFWWAGGTVNGSSGLQCANGWKMTWGVKVLLVVRRLEKFYTSTVHSPFEVHTTDNNTGSTSATHLSWGGHLLFNTPEKKRPWRESRGERGKGVNTNLLISESSRIVKCRHCTPLLLNILLSLGWIEKSIKCIKISWEC